MKTLKTIAQIRQELKAARQHGQTIGLVPTMGYLHQGHLSLVRQSKQENDVTVVSIFVNPSQFGPHEDFDRYPRNPEGDEQLLREMDVEMVFSPGLKEIYPGGYATYVEVEKLGQALCGKSRPSHFRGVTTVVLKLLNIVSPTRAYFGRKDAQQAILIKRMVRELNLEVMIETLPIVRAPDGLALSSRNAYLSTEEREAALCLSRALKKAEAEIANGRNDAAAIKKTLQTEAGKNPLVKIDYLEVVTLDTLEPREIVDPANTLVAGAIRVGKTRLIDNFILGEI